MNKPVGLKPAWIWRLQRIEEIHEAMVRYVNGQVPIPRDWVSEAASHVKFMRMIRRVDVVHDLELAINQLCEASRKYASRSEFSQTSGQTAEN